MLNSIKYKNLNGSFWGLFGVTETIQHFGPPLPNCCWLESPVGQVHLVVEDVHQGPFEEIATQPLKVSEFG